MNKRIFDSSCMTKEKPKIPKEYQPKILKRMLGIVSPSLRLVHYNPDYEIKYLKWLCWERKLSRYWWRVLVRMIKERDRC